MTAIAERLAEPAAPRRREWTAGVMIGLGVLACLVIAVLLGVALWLSFAEGTPGDYHLGYSLANYREIFFSPFTYRVVANTFVFSGITLIVALLFGLPMAFLVERTDFPASARSSPCSRWRCLFPASRWRSAGSSCSTPAPASSMLHSKGCSARIPRRSTSRAFSAWGWSRG